jgi:hypothetical protein
MRHLAAPASALVLFATLAGCGDGGSTAGGTVTFDGQPVATGTVTFAKSNGGLVREGAVITDGSFQAVVPPGKYKVEVTASKVVGGRKQKGFDGKDEEVELREETIPPRYNAETELAQEIKPGANTVTLELKSGK